MWWNSHFQWTVSFCPADRLLVYLNFITDSNTVRCLFTVNVHTFWRFQCAVIEIYGHRLCSFTPHFSVVYLSAAFTHTCSEIVLFLSNSYDRYEKMSSKVTGLSLLEDCLNDTPTAIKCLRLCAISYSVMFEWVIIFMKSQRTLAKQMNKF